jgi:hypothetical protein
MDAILNALPSAAETVSDLLSQLFSSGIGLIVVPFLLIELVILVFKTVRGSGK